MQYEVSMTLSESDLTNGLLNDSLRDISASMEQMMTQKISELEEELHDAPKKGSTDLRAYCRKSNQENEEHDCSFTNEGMNTSMQALKKMNEFINIDDSNKVGLDEVTRQLEFVLDRCKLEMGDDICFGDESTGSTFVPTSFDDGSETECYFDGDSLCLDEEHGREEETKPIDQIGGELSQFPTHVDTLCTGVDGSFLERLKDTMGCDFVNRFDKESIYEMKLGQDILVEKQMLIEALDILMAERSTFLNELITMYELEEEK